MHRPRPLPPEDSPRPARRAVGSWFRRPGAGRARPAGRPRRARPAPRDGLRASSARSASSNPLRASASRSDAGPALDFDVQLRSCSRQSTTPVQWPEARCSVASRSGHCRGRGGHRGAEGSHRTGGSSAVPQRWPGAGAGRPGSLRPRPPQAGLQRVGLGPPPAPWPGRRGLQAPGARVPPPAPGPCRHRALRVPTASASPAPPEEFVRRSGRSPLAGGSARGAAGIASSTAPPRRARSDPLRRPPRRSAGRAPARSNASMARSGRCRVSSRGGPPPARPPPPPRVRLRRPLPGQPPPDIVLPEVHLAQAPRISAPPAPGRGRRGRRRAPGRIAEHRLRQLAKAQMVLQPPAESVVTPSRCS